MITGFCGRVFSQCSDPALGQAVTRAWNDWFFDEWYSPYPERIIPMGITYLTDPEVGAAEIYRNAERGLQVRHAPRTPPPHRSAVDLRGVLGADHRGLCRDRHRGEPACRIVGIGRNPDEQEHADRTGRHALRPTVIDRVL